jgi:hypothetical protein
MPLIRRLPKRGFNNAAFHKRYAIVNLSDLNSFKSGSVVDEESLRTAKLIRGDFYGIKILGDGELRHELTVRVEKVSASARQKIEKAGGTISAPSPQQQGAEKDSAEAAEELENKRASVRKRSKSATKKSTRKPSAKAKPKKKSARK